MKQSTISCLLFWILAVMITGSLAAQPDRFRRMRYPGKTIPFRQQSDSLLNIPPGFDARPKRPERGWGEFLQNRLKGPQARLGKYQASGSLIDTVQPDEAWQLGRLHSGAGTEILPEWVRHYGSGLEPSVDDADAIALDTLGNVYVTGSSTGSPFSRDFLTVKYDSNGTVVWTARHGGEAGGDDKARSVAVDASGNVYVTGESEGMEGSFDFATVKYNSFGIQQWIARYRGEANSFANPRELAVDAFGSVYLMGSMGGKGCVTVKYDSSGIEQWVARIEGSQGSDLAIDAVGNVYVTGYNSASGVTFHSDYITAKYGTQGDQQWLARYSGPYSNSENYAQALAIDPSGNVYVTGSSYTPGISNENYVTVKYDSSGVQRWLVEYDPIANSIDRASDIVIDPSGCVYVAGTSVYGETNDIVTIKYDSSGIPQWEAKYDASFDWNAARFIVLDVHGSVYVCGNSYVGSYSGGFFPRFATLKYDSSGVLQWLTNYPASQSGVVSGFAIDNVGNVFVAGTAHDSLSSSNYATIKYDTEGNQQWVALFDGSSNSNDGAAAVALDGLGNVYVTGEDYATLKYNSSGMLLWSSRQLYGNATAIAVDVASNVYVSGDAEGDIVTIKYNNSGVEEWLARYNGPANHWDAASAIALDSWGNLYVTGESYDSGYAYSSYVTIKYNTSGTEEWAVRYKDSTGGFNWPRALAVDDSGNVYVTGDNGYWGFSSEYTGDATIKYDASGTLCWVARKTVPDRTMWLTDLVLDGLGNVYVAGGSYGASNARMMTAKYSPTGVLLWVQQDTSQVQYVEDASIVLDDFGNILVAGRSLIKYDPSGYQQWIVSVTEDPYLWSTSLAVDQWGNSFVAQTGAHGASVHKYNASGVGIWYGQFDGPGTWGWPFGMTTGDDGSVFLVGSNYGEGWSVSTLVKYKDTQISEVELNNEIPGSFSLSQNFPNPFNPSTKIQFSVVSSQLTVLKIFDLLGREVATLVNEEMKPGSYEVTWDATGFPSGVYFYRLSAGEFMETKRLILLR